jgi:alpha-amylase
MMTTSCKIQVFIFLLLFGECFAHSATEWKSRTVYQLLTDRFARTDDNNTPCYDLSNYCGGTFQGLKQHFQKNLVVVFTT